MHPPISCFHDSVLPISRPTFHACSHFRSHFEACSHGIPGTWLMSGLSKGVLLWSLRSYSHSYIRIMCVHRVGGWCCGRLKYLHARLAFPMSAVLHHWTVRSVAFSLCLVPCSASLVYAQLSHSGVVICTYMYINTYVFVCVLW